MKKTITTIAAGAASLMFIGSASAAVIIPSGISSFHQGDSAPGGAGADTTTIDGSGMTKGDVNDPSTWTVSNTDWQNDWQGQSTPTGTNTWAVLDISTADTSLLGTMYLWNVQETNALTRGMQNFEIYYASAAGIPAVPATSATVTSYDFNAAGNNWTQLGGTNVLNIGTQVGDPGQTFDVSGAAGAQYIGLRILTNHGNTSPGRTGFGEVAFTTIPEPGAMSLLLAGGLLGLLRRRR